MNIWTWHHFLVCSSTSTVPIPSTDFTCTASNQYNKDTCENAYDNDINTKWNTEARKWVGEKLEINLHGSYTIGKIYLRQRNKIGIDYQIKEIKLTFSDGSTQNITFKPTARKVPEQTFDLIPVQTDSITILGVSVQKTPSMRYGFTEIKFYECSGNECFNNTQRKNFVSFDTFRFTFSKTSNPQHLQDMC